MFKRKWLVTKLGRFSGSFSSCKIKTTFCFLFLCSNVLQSLILVQILVFILWHLISSRSFLWKHSPRFFIKPLVNLLNLTSKDPRLFFLGSLDIVRSCHKRIFSSNLLSVSVCRFRSTHMFYAGQCILKKIVLLKSRLMLDKVCRISFLLI